MDVVFSWLRESNCILFLKLVDCFLKYVFQLLMIHLIDGFFVVWEKLYHSFS